MKNVQFCSSSRTILQDSRIGQLSSCPQGRGAWTPRVNAKILTTDAPQEMPLGCIHLVFRGLKSESDAEIGQNGTFFKGLSVDIHICIVTHAIPNTFGITVFTMIVLSVKKSVFVVNGFIFTHPHPTVCTVYILNIFFLHEKIDSACFMKNFYEISGLGLCIGSP